MGLTRTVTADSTSLTSTALDGQVVTFTGNFTNTFTGTYSVNGGCDAMSAHIANWAALHPNHACTAFCSLLSHTTELIFTDIADLAAGHRKCSAFPSIRRAGLTLGTRELPFLIGAD